MVWTNNYKRVILDDVDWNKALRCILVFYYLRFVKLSQFLNVGFSGYIDSVTAAWRFSLRSWDVKSDAVIIKTVVITNKSNIESNLIGIVKLTILNR